MATGGGFVAPYSFHDDDDIVGPVVMSEGSLEFTIEVIDRVSPMFAMMAQLLEGVSAVRSSFAGLGRAMSDFILDPWPQLYVAPDPAGDVLYPAATPQPWARHDREKTTLELAIERWKRENPPPPPPSFSFRLPAFERGETAARDTIDCSSSNGARWSDLMSRIDELTEET